MYIIRCSVPSRWLLELSLRQFSRSQMCFVDSIDVTRRNLRWDPLSVPSELSNSAWPEAPRTHGQCERGLLPSQGAHHCLGRLRQEPRLFNGISAAVSEPNLQFLVGKMMTHKFLGTMGCHILRRTLGNQ